MSTSQNWTPIIPDPDHKAKRKALFKSLSDSKVSHGKELLQTMRGLLVFSGAVAVGALVLLGTNAPVEQYLIIIGIVVLLLQCAIIIIYLLQGHTSAMDEVDTVIDKFLDPVDKIEVSLTNPSMDIPLAKKLIAQIDSVQKIGEQITNGAHKEKRIGRIFEVVILALFLFGISMIMVGLVSKSICATWNILCI
jgi:hypothetical protein